MERTKKLESVEEQVQPVTDGKIWWRKTGGGSLRLHGKMIKPGERFQAYPSDIPLSIRDIVLPLEELIEEQAKPVLVAKTSYKIQPRGKSKSLFDVVNLSGKVLNEKALTKEVAQKLVKDLES